MITLNEVKKRKEELSPEDKQQLEKMLADSKRQLKTMSKNDLIRIIQEMSLKVSILENIVNNAIKEEKNETNT